MEYTSQTVAAQKNQWQIMKILLEIEADRDRRTGRNGLKHPGKSRLSTTHCVFDCSDDRDFFTSAIKKVEGFSNPNCLG